jgi:hypothetical protein
MATIKSFKQLRETGGIVSKEPVKRAIAWKTVDPETGEEVDFDAEVYIIKQGSGAMLEIMADESKEQVCVLLSKSVLLLDDKGKLALIDFDDAYRLDAPLRTALWEEIKKISGIARKNLPPSTSSSVSSSPTESAAAP